MGRSVDDIFIFVDDDEEHGQENFFVKYVLFSITKIILSSTNIFVIHSPRKHTQRMAQKIAKAHFSESWKIKININC